MFLPTSFIIFGDIISDSIRGKERYLHQSGGSSRLGIQVARLGVHVFHITYRFTCRSPSHQNLLSPCLACIYYLQAPSGRKAAAVSVVLRKSPHVSPKHPCATAKRRVRTVNCPQTGKPLCIDAKQIPVSDLERP